MSSAVALAKAEVSENAKASHAMHEFARVREADAEGEGQKVLEKHGFAAPIEIDCVDLGPEKRLKGFPYMKFSNWLKYLLDTGRLPRVMCGCTDLPSMRVKLREFWSRYQKIHPWHGIFDLQKSGTDLSLVLPVYSHSDEGRSYKKQALFVLNTHSALGRGTQAWLKKGKDKSPLHRNGFGLNFVGGTWSTHCMFTCMLRKFHKKNGKVLDQMLQLYADDMEFLLKTGVESSEGFRIRCCHLGHKGDLPALARAGHMLHTFGNVPRAASSQKPCQGVCWMCKAGQERNPRLHLDPVPFEDSSGAPLWEQTLGQQQPWLRTPELLSGVPLEPRDHWTFYKTDIWHNLHLGVGKQWCASAFVSFVDNLDFGGGMSMDDKVEALNSQYKAWCKMKRITPHVEELGRETRSLAGKLVSWPTSASCPCGSWHKGAATTHFMQFLEWFCEQHKDECAADPLLQAIATGTSAMNTVMASLYQEGFFIRAYKAQRALRDSGGWALSPLGESVQMEEDFIGRPSRMSRRVNPKRIHYRVCQRTLISAMIALKQSDKDDRGLFTSHFL
ncbi:unnamed protein product [Cladocopium goreaui]|uniref:Uncharacterized protein n=1 Tax=Cladocopium goreaui TaxID=2562237 RepID=A0A9P1DSR7_9DINO|nr:unnamed protein product [Cladocopium goreaui]